MNPEQETAPPTGAAATSHPVGSAGPGRPGAAVRERHGPVARSSRRPDGLVGRAATSASSWRCFILCLVGIATAGQQFASIDNALTILRLAAVIGVVSVGMTFVITGGGIDLSVGAIVGARLGLVDDPGHPDDGARTTTGRSSCSPRSWSGTVCGLVNGLLIAYGRVVPFIATLAMLAAARGLAEIIAQRRTQIVDVPGFSDFFRHSVLGIPLLVIIFALVAAVGWVVLNRTTFGRRTFAVGGNPEAARLAGIDVTPAHGGPLRDRPDCAAASPR